MVVDGVIHYSTLYENRSPVFCAAVSPQWFYENRSPVFCARFSPQWSTCQDFLARMNLVISMLLREYVITYDVIGIELSRCINALVHAMLGWANAGLLNYGEA